MERSSHIIKKLDWISIFIYFTLVGFGWMNIYAAVYSENYTNILKERYTMQLLWIVVAFIIAIIIFVIDARVYEFLAYPIYLFTIILLVAVLLFGREVNGARSWFEIGGFRLQPAEFAKLATALAVSRLMSIYDFRINRLEDLIKVGILIFIPIALIIMQNDTGSALVYFSFIIVLYREGLSPWYLILMLLFAILFVLSLVVSLLYLFIALPIIAVIIVHVFYQNSYITLIGIGAVVFIGLIMVFNHFLLHFNPVYVIVAAIIFSILALAYPAFVHRIKNYGVISFILVGAVVFIFSVEYFFNHVLEKHQRTRINVVLGLESDPQGVEYNVRQSKIAIGSGEFFGKGFMQGTQTKFEFVPEQDTDFIFCTVGEEWGFIGTVGVLGLFTLLLLRIIYIAERQRSKMNRIYAYCVASILFFHVAINIGMTIGLAPVIGIPLPFFSYGGSSLWSFTILFFVLLKLDTARMDKF